MKDTTERSKSYLAVHGYSDFADYVISLSSYSGCTQIRVLAKALIFAISLSSVHVTQVWDKGANNDTGSCCVGFAHFYVSNLGVSVHKSRNGEIHVIHQPVRIS